MAQKCLKKKWIILLNFKAYVIFSADHGYELKGLLGGTEYMYIKLYPNKGRIQLD